MDNLLDDSVAIGLPAALLYFFFIGPLRRVFRSRGWLKTPCVIRDSAVEEDPAEPGVYRIVVRYEYEVGGRSYSSSRYDFSTGATAGYRRKKAIVGRLTPGTRAVCYVDPSSPHDSVIDRRITWDVVFWGLFATVLLVTFGFFLWTRFASGGSHPR
jgi:hypothetical protein